MEYSFDQKNPDINEDKTDRGNEREYLKCTRKSITRSYSFAFLRKYFYEKCLQNNHNTTVRNIQEMKTDEEINSYTASSEYEIVSKIIEGYSFLWLRRILTIGRSWWQHLQIIWKSS